MLTSVVEFYTRVQAPVHERLAFLGRDDDVVLADDAEYGQVGGEGEVPVKGWFLCVGEEAAYGHDDCVSAACNACMMRRRQRGARGTAGRE